MKKSQIILAALFMATSLSFGQNKSSWMIPNPAFEKYLELKRTGSWSATTVDGHSLGYLPNPVTVRDNPTPAILPDYKSTQDTMPSRFDLRDSSLVTSVKDQGGGDAGGNCTMFATMGSLESRWLKTGLDTFDLSEQNLAACHGYEWTYGEGANEFICSAYLTRFDGPTLETLDPYNTSVHTCAELDPIALIPEVRWLPGFDRQALKKAIYYHGAVFVSIHYTPDNSGFRDSDDTYYYDGTDYPNHALLVCGWDDSKATAGGTGAWIVKNSWGPGWAENGFVHVAYQDTRIASEMAYFPVRWDVSEVDSIYLYDHFFMGYKTIGVPGSNSVYELAKFTAPQEQVLTRVGISAIDSMTYFDIEIYDDFSGSELSGLLASEKGFITEYAGYYTVDIPATVNGDFYIKVKRSIEGGSDPANDTIFMPVEIYNEDYVNPVIEPDVNWYSSTGNLWFSTSEGGSPFNLTIRAYTSNDTGPRALFKANKLSACVGSDVEFTFQENDPVTSWTWDFGQGASPRDTTGPGPHYINYSSVGTKTISLIVDDAGVKDTLVKHDYIHITDHINVTVLEKKITINLGDSARMIAYGADDYIWTPSTTLSSGSGDTVYVTPTDVGDYSITLYGSSQGGCTGYDYIDIVSVNPPLNDNMCNAILITPVGNVGTYSNTYGTTQPGEPQPPGTHCVTDSTWCANEDGAVATIWFKFYGPASGIARFESGGAWDNQIAVYQADSCINIGLGGLVGANDDETASIYPAKLSVQVIPEFKYFLQVDGSGNTQEGTFILYFYDSPTGLEELEDALDGLSVYPNPARDIFHVRMQGVESGRITLQVYNVKGQLVNQGSYSDLGSEFYTRIDLSDYPAGVYHMQLIDGERILHRKIVRE